ERVEPRSQVERSLVRKAGTDPTRIDQAITLVNTEHQRADSRAALLLMGEACDDEFLARADFGLDPLRAAPGKVRPFHSLRNHALDPELCSLLEHFVAARLEVVGISDRADAAAALDELSQGRLAIDERSAPEVMAVEMKEIEGKEGEAPLIVRAECLLQRTEAGVSLLVQDDHLPAEGERVGGGRLDRSDQAPDPVRPVLTGARQQAGPLGVAAAIDAIAVELDFVDPVPAVRWTLHRRCELRWNEFLE